MWYHIGIMWYHLIFLNYLNLILIDIIFLAKKRINGKTMPRNFTIYSVFPDIKKSMNCDFDIAKSVLDVFPP